MRCLSALRWYRPHMVVVYDSQAGNSRVGDSIKGEGELNMAKGRNLSVVPKTKGRKSVAGKNVNRVVDDAAKKAQKTEQKYEEKRGIFTK
jgi:hypothetical protein